MATAVLPIDQARARDTLAALTERAAGLIRSIADPDRPAAHSAWSVGEVAAHLVVGARAWSACIGGPGSPITDLDGFAELNDRLLRWFAERDPVRLADLLVEAEREFLRRSADLPGDAAVPWHGGHAVPLSVATAIAVEELLMHGYDIAVALKRPWPLEPEVARLVLAGTATVMPWFVEPAARGVCARYAIHVGGGPHFVCRFDGGTLTVTATPAGPVDCHIAADPVTFLLVAYRRVPQWRPILRGKLRAWGRRPWLALRFTRLVGPP